MRNTSGCLRKRPFQLIVDVLFPVFVGRRLLLMNERSRVLFAVAGLPWTVLVMSVLVDWVLDEVLWRFLEGTVGI